MNTTSLTTAGELNPDSLELVYNGGYGYCMGPAVCENYVVAGALVFGGDGGVLRIYGITGAVGSV